MPKFWHCFATKLRQTYDQMLRRLTLTTNSQNLLRHTLRQCLQWIGVRRSSRAAGFSCSNGWSSAWSTIHRVSIKTTPFIFGYNFCEWRPIFKILSLTYSERNSLCTVIEISTSPYLCCYTTLWNLKIPNNWQTIA